MNKNTTKSNSTKTRKIEETLEQQVMRVVNEMVTAGELNTKEVNGVTMYSLSENLTPSDIAKKAWTTRCKNKITTTSLKGKATKKTTKAVNKNRTTNSNSIANRQTEVAKKAWTTRHEKKARLVAAAKKAGVTRRLTKTEAIVKAASIACKQSAAACKAWVTRRKTCATK
jgi:hypothetical protein